MSYNDIAAGAYELYYPVTTYNANMPFQLLLASEFGRKKTERFQELQCPQGIFCYVIEGEGSLVVNNETCYPKKGDFFFLPKGLPHLGITDPERPWWKLYFDFEGWLAEEMIRAYNLEGRYYVPNCPVEPLFREILQLAKEKDTDVHEKAAVVFHRILGELEKRLARLSSKYSRHVRRTMTFLDQNIEEHLTMDDIAEHADLSAEHLTRIFKQEVGVTPYAYLTTKRLKLAKVYLRSTPLSIKAIAYCLNYSDEFYFSNTFKKHFGMPPNQYRKEHLSNVKH